MSTPASSPPRTPIESCAPGTPSSTIPPPSTPPNPPATIRVTLPTPSSFGAHRRSHSVNSPASGTDSPRKESRETPKRGHNRTVSFNQDVQVKTMSPESKLPVSSGLYQIPQRHEDDAFGSAIDDPSPRTRKGPPSALSLGSRSSFGQLLSSPFAGPKTAPVASRFASTAAARGLSIAPALAKMKEKRTVERGSIWSAGLTSTGGWITPGLASARSTTSAASTTARQRGLSVAVIKDGKEMLVDSGPITPGLPSGRRKSIDTKSGEGGAPVSHTDIKSPRPLSATRPKEVILCRYYHTPGLTCTSRPCRFVHDLATLPTSPSVDPAKLRMLSPTKSPDLTMGTFAQAQANAIARTQPEDVAGSGIDVSEAQPGEVVVLSGNDGKEMMGAVFYMSGGGKGPAGKSKAKFKTVACRDFAAGYCPYGESCSFIHEDKQSVHDNTQGTKNDHTSAVEEDGNGHSTEKSRTTSAWSRGPPKFSKSLLPKDRLSAFAAPYSSNPVAVDATGDVKDASLVPPPPALVAAARVKSAWSRGPPHLLTTPKPTSRPSSTPPSLEIVDESQEVEMPIPTPSHAHLMPPISAWTVASTDSDPAGPWDPANLAKRSSAASARPMGFEALTYPWGIPMSPVPPTYPEHPGVHQSHGASPILWTPSGWAVQDAAMKRAMAAVEMNGQERNTHRTRRGGKNYYRKRPCKFYAQGDCPHGDSCTYLHVLPTAHQQPDGSDTEVKTHKPVPTLPCKFFNSQAGCENGDTCTFLHTSVIPAGAVSVPRPRPWRTRPCRHFQLARCNLGDACYFAHVVDPNFVLPKGYQPTANTTGQLCRAGVCELGESCRYVHYRDPATGPAEEQAGEDHSQTEGKLEALRKMVSAAALHDDSEDEDEEDDVQIVTVKGVELKA